MRSSTAWTRVVIAALLLLLDLPAQAEGTTELTAPSISAPAPATPGPVAARPDAKEQLSAILLSADTLAGQGKVPAARRAYERALKLKPDSRAAIRGLLWLLIGQVAAAGKDATPERNQLSASLVRFRPMTRRGTTLWRAYAAGNLVLGRPQDALSFFALGRRHGAADPLWWADWANTLQRTNRPTPARRLVRRAIPRLLPKAIKAAHKGASPYETELLRTYVLLVRTERAPGVGVQWLRAVFKANLDPALARELKGLWQKSKDEIPPEATLNSAAFRKGMLVRLRGAPAETDVKPATVSKPAAGADADDDEEDDEDDSEDDTDDTAEGDDSDADSADDTDDAAAVSGSDPADQSPPEVEDEAEEPETARRFTASLGFEARSLGGLQLVETKGRSDLTIGRLGLGLRVGYAYLFTPAEWTSTELHGLRWGELDVAALTRWRLRKGQLELGLGGNFRAAQSLPYGWFHGDYELRPGLIMELNAGLNQVMDDTFELRLVGTRDRVAPGIDFDLTQREFINAFAGWQRYQTRQRELLSDGYVLYLEAGHRLLLANPGWSVRLSGYLEQNRIVTQLPPSLKLQLAGTDFAVSDFVIPVFALVGVGTTLRRGVPGVVPIGERRLQLFADLWLGCLLPQRSFGFDLQLGLGVPLPRAGELSFSGFIANSRHPGGVDPLSMGAGLRYTY